MCTMCRLLNFHDQSTKVMRKKKQMGAAANTRTQSIRANFIAIGISYFSNVGHFPLSLCLLIHDLTMFFSIIFIIEVANPAVR